MSQDRIVVIDYHKGNLLSVARSLSAVGATVEISDEPQAIQDASGLILPGVGSFEDAMSYLHRSGQADAIVSCIKKGVPFLGICLGEHLLFERGSEKHSQAWGNEWVPGLGILKGSITRLESSRLKVPHVGWNQIHLTPVGERCPLFVDVPEGSNVYFTHSYASNETAEDAYVATRTHYTRSFASGVWRENVFGVQFHPEKSSKLGLRILSNFVSIVRG